MHWRHTSDYTDHPVDYTDYTAYLNLGLPLALCRVLYAHIATLADSYLTEPFVVVIVLPCRSDSVRTSFGLLLMYLDYLSALPYWILFADRWPTLALGLLSALSVSYLFADVFDPACFVTMSINKRLQMDLHASRLIGSVTTLIHNKHYNREI